LSVLTVNTQVARAIIRKPHVALWPKRLDSPAVKSAFKSVFFLFFSIGRRMLTVTSSHFCRNLNVTTQSLFTALWNPRP